jgi:hypothetical protein
MAMEKTVSVRTEQPAEPQEPQRPEEEQSPAEPQEFELRAKGEGWEGVVSVRSDGTFKRRGTWAKKGEEGQWEVSRSKSRLTLNWDDKDPETVVSDDLGVSFKNGEGLILTTEGGEAPEWFRTLFEKQDGRCMQACLFCCPASVTEHEEGEPETIIHQLWEHVESVVEKIDDGIDAVQDKVEDVVEAVVDAVDDVRDAIVDALGLNDKFVEVSDNALDDIAPKAGDVVIEEASNFIPAFQKLDDRVPQDLDGAAKAACAATILGFRGKIHDFCQDVVELLKEGADMIGAALKCLYKVTSWILRACKEGVEKAVELLKAVIPDCCEAACLSCMGLASKLGQWISTAFNRIVDMVEDFLKAAMRTFGVPEWICEKVDFNGNASADNANDDDEPLNHHHHALKDEDAPAQQAMGGGGASSP